MSLRTVYTKKTEMKSIYTAILVMCWLAYPGSGNASAAFASSASVNADDTTATQVFWVKNFQFFSGEYRIGATQQRSSANGEFFVENAVVTSLLVDDANGVVYAGTAHGGVFKRDVGGNKWTSLATGTSATDIPVDADKEGYSAINDMVFSALGDLIVGTDDGIHMYDSGSDSWSEIGGDLLSGSGVTAVFDLFVTGNTIYAGLGGYLWRNDELADGDLDVNMGVIVSYNNGSSWSRLSTGLPISEDGYYLEVYSIEKEGSTLRAATPVGLFTKEANQNLWRGDSRELTVISPILTIGLAESTRPEVQKGKPGETWWEPYYRWLTIESGVLSGSETDSIYINLFGDFGQLEDEGDSISQWFCPVTAGILTDDGEFMVELGGTSVHSNVGGLFSGYDTFPLVEMRFGEHTAVGTIIDIKTELMLILSDENDPLYEIGGQFATVTYDDGDKLFTWSTKIEAFKEPNKGRRGVLLNNSSLMGGGRPDYLALNDPTASQYLSASTIDNSELFTSQVNITPDSVAGYSGDVNCLAMINNQLLAGTSAGVVSYSEATGSWSLLPFLIPYTPVPVHAISSENGDLVAGSEFGYFTFDADDSVWVATNLDLYSYISASALDELVVYLEDSTPAHDSRGIYEILTDAFGIERMPDTDGSSKIPILLHNIHDITETWNNSSNGSEGGIDEIRGYVRTSDQSLSGRTNRRDMIYISTKGVSSEERGGAIAHQIMRLMTLNQDINEERWIWEGICYIGDKLCGFPQPAIWAEIAQYSNYGLPLIVGTPTVDWAVSPDGGTALGELHTKAAMWMTYLYENLGGLDFILALMDDTENGIASIEGLLDNGQFLPEDITDLSFRDLYTGWSLANSLTDSTRYDPSTNLRWGYLESAFTNSVNAFKISSSSPVGYKLLGQFAFPEDALEEYEKIIQQPTYASGLNSWATIYREFSYVGTPEPWMDKIYSINFDDDLIFSAWLIKTTSSGVQTVIFLNDMLDASQELSLDIYAEFGPGGTFENPTYDYTSIVLGLSNQNPISRGGRLILSNDQSPPEVAMTVMQNPAFPEFANIYIWSNERLHRDVSAAENPAVFIDRGYGANPLSIQTYVAFIKDDALQGIIYSGDFEIGRGESITVSMTDVQDIVGNDTTVAPLNVALNKITDISHISKLISSDGLTYVEFPAYSLSSPVTVTLVDESPKMLSFLQDVPVDRFEGAVAIVTVGPGGRNLNEKSLLSMRLDPAGFFPEHLGLYRLDNGNFIPIEARFSPATGVLSAEIEVLGTYVATNSQNLASTVVILPTNYRLSQNYPNPFNPTTSIAYDLPVDGTVEIRIYNLMGRQVNQLVNEYRNAGRYSVEWSGLDDRGYRVSSGMYIYTIRSGDFTASRKMILLK